MTKADLVWTVCGPVLVLIWIGCAWWGRAAGGARKTPARDIAIGAFIIFLMCLVAWPVIISHAPMRKSPPRRESVRPDHSIRSAGPRVARVPPLTRGTDGANRVVRP